MHTPYTAHSSPSMLFEFRGLEALPCGCVAARLCCETALARRGGGGSERAPLHGWTPRQRFAADVGHGRQQDRRLMGVTGGQLRISSASAASLSAQVRAWDSASSRV